MHLQKNMKTLKEIKNILAKHMEILESQYKVKSIGVFGSYIKGRQKKGSDLDILVEFFEPVSLLKFIHLENYLSEILGVRVDLVMKDALKPRIGKHILREVVNV